MIPLITRHPEINLTHKLFGEGIFLTNENAGHGGDMSDRNFVIEFFKINRDSTQPNYNITNVYEQLEVIMSIDDF
jgi:hypothetical protein